MRRSRRSSRSRRWRRRRVCVGCDAGTGCSDLPRLRRRWTGRPRRVPPPPLAVRAVSIDYHASRRLVKDVRLDVLMALLREASSGALVLSRTLSRMLSDALGRSRTLSRALSDALRRSHGHSCTVWNVLGKRQLIVTSERRHVW